MTNPEAGRSLTERSLRVLEFNKILERLSSFALTEMGAARCRELLPLSTLSEAEYSQKETEEALVELTYSGASPLTAFRDVRPSLDLAKKGATLSIRALLDVAVCLRAMSAARSALVTDKENMPVLKAIASSLSTFRPLEKQIGEAILSEEEIADSASPELTDIRRHIRLCNDRIRDRLQSMIHSPSYAKYLQEAIVTIRNGRYVLPVRQEYRQNVPGLIHDQSSTGATLFIEPTAVVEAGNDLKQWQAKEQQEIDRILLLLSSSVGACAGDAAVSVEILILLDFIFAKARLAQDMGAIEPRLNDRGRLKLVKARHPLISRDTVVPCDLWLGESFTTLIITGPNTGGKTVTLKTAGLMSVMAQAGLHVPCDLGTDLNVFRHIYADIGDEQSIEQSLSTFSSHMGNIVAILGQAEPGDFVLLDELGAGTDPAEGAALAQAVLDHLLKAKARVIATTHYSELKAYALSTEGVENASVEFDVATLRPTYRLSIGIPGKSNAFEISARLGLPSSLIAQARDLMSRESLRFEDVIANAEYHRQVAEKERKLAEEAHQETVRLRSEAEALWRDIEGKRASAAKKAKDEARKILEKTKRECAQIVSELNLLKKDNQGRGQGAQAAARNLQALEDSLSEGLRPSSLPGSKPTDRLEVGDPVEILALNARGTVLSKPDAKGDLLVLAGAIKMKMNLNQLRRTQEEAKAAKTTIRAPAAAADRSVRLECDVRGMALDEAIAEVERYLDSVVLAGMHEVSIIHGKGTGTLRAGIQRHLKSYPHVKAFRTGRYGEGEGGVTVVSLK